MLLEDELNHVRRRLSTLLQCPWHPTLLPLLLAETRVHDTPKAVERHKDDVMALEKTAGVFHNFAYAGVAAPGAFVPQEARDFDDVLGKLSPICIRTLWLRFKCKMTLEKLDFGETRLCSADL